MPEPDPVRPSLNVDPNDGLWQVDHDQPRFLIHAHTIYRSTDMTSLSSVFISILICASFLLGGPNLFLCMAYWARFGTTNKHAPHTLRTYCTVPAVLGPATRHHASSKHYIHGDNKSRRPRERLALRHRDRPDTRPDTPTHSRHLAMG